MSAAPAPGPVPARSAGVHVAVVRLPHGADLPLPAYASAGAAGLDLLAAVTAPLCLAPMQRLLVPTGLTVEIPPGFEAQVRPRSGLALRHGITCLNSPGTIDSDYRGEIQVILANLGQDPVTITRGMRIAQLVLAPVAHLVWDAVTDLSTSERGTRGFGSTGSGAPGASV